MGLDDKIKNSAEEMTGKVKEGVGKATDNEDLEAEGKLDQAKADAKQAGEHVKDAAKHAGDSVRDGFKD
ncbi:MAG: CsbD family protein [Microbacterium sp.]|uniref:CsbD family protein n=1 Tax=Microbacterium sp. TaxID=51671 RepID=UPI003BB0B287